MSFGISEIENTITSLLGAFLAEPFRVETFADTAVKQLHADGKNEERVRREAELILAGQEDLFLTPDMCYPKEPFFRGTKFRILPGRSEIEKNILLPGARFTPFSSIEHFHDEFQLHADTGTCEANSIVLPFGEIAPSSLLLGHDGLIDCLCAESDANYRALRAERDLAHTRMDITAFDMTEFYKAHNFQYGDTIIVTVESWTNAQFSLAYCKGTDNPQRADRALFLQRFEDAMLEVCAHEHDSMEIPQQIAHAYLCAFLRSEDIRFTPDFPLDEYPSSMCEIAIRHDGSEWVLVPADSLSDPGISDAHAHAHEDGECACGHDHAHENKEQDVTDIKPEHFSASGGTLESMDAILTERNAPMDTVELHSLVLDSMSNGVENFADYLARVQSLLGIDFADDAQEAAFLNYLEDDWEITSEYFNPSFEENKEPLRVRLLDLSEQRVDLSLRLLEHFKHNVPHNLAHPLASFHRDVSETLSLLAADAPLPDGDDREKLELRIDDLESAWEELQDRLNDSME